MVVPVAILHGLFQDASTHAREAGLLANFTGAPVVSVEYMAGIDTLSTSLFDQAKNACDALQAEAVLADAPLVDLIGHSNGAVIARWVIQNCPWAEGRIRNFVSVGGPQQGVTAIPEQWVKDQIMKSGIKSFSDWIYSIKNGRGEF